MTTYFRRRRRRRSGGGLARLAMLAAAVLALWSAARHGLPGRLADAVETLLSDPATAAAILGAGDPADGSLDPPAATATAAPVPTVAPTPAPTHGPATGLIYYGAVTPDPAPSQTPLGDTYAVTAAGLRLDNGSGYDIDPAALMAQGIGEAAGTRVLILHTHTCEAYLPDGDDLYEESDPSRTEDPAFNVVRVGDELADALTARGIAVVHDTGLYDSPTYSGSYSRALEAIEARLEEYPDIGIVIDLHRDALEDAQGNIYSTSCLVGGEKSAQILLLGGTDACGLENPDWQQNLTLLLYLQAAMDARYPGLTRPLCVSQYRYNTHATTGSFLLEVGCNGNTLQEALTAVRCFAEVCADVLQGRAVWGG